MDIEVEVTEVAGEGEEVKLFVVKLPCGIEWLIRYKLAIRYGRKMVGEFMLFEFEFFFVIVFCFCF